MINQGKPVDDQPIFKAIGTKNGTWIICTEACPSWRLRSGLDEKHARRLAEELDRVLRVKLTDPNCMYCHGIGGCHNCDS